MAERGEQVVSQSLLVNWGMYIQRAESDRTYHITGIFRQG